MDEREERIFVVAYERASINPEYLEYLKRLTNTENEIIRLLGSSNLLLECENLICAANNILLESVYRIGLEEGKAFSRQLVIGDKPK